jgi:hypothetical protein
LSFTTRHAGRALAVAAAPIAGVPAGAFASSPPPSVLKTPAPAPGANVPKIAAPANVRAARTAPWLSGSPNYGFVLKNRDENLGTFTNKRCLTAYTNPTLELTYY